MMRGASSTGARTDRGAGPWADSIDAPTETSTTGNPRRVIDLQPPATHTGDGNCTAPVPECPARRARLDGSLETAEASEKTAGFTRLANFRQLRQSRERRFFNTEVAEEAEKLLGVF